MEPQTEQTTEEKATHVPEWSWKGDTQITVRGDLFEAIMKDYASKADAAGNTLAIYQGLIGAFHEAVDAGKITDQAAPQTQPAE